MTVQCLGCGRHFSERGLRAHQSSRFISMACRPERLPKRITHRGESLLILSDLPWQFVPNAKWDAKKPKEYININGVVWSINRCWMEPGGDGVLVGRQDGGLATVIYPNAKKGACNTLSQHLARAKREAAK
jgi:hypothetical protein